MPYRASGEVGVALSCYDNCLKAKTLMVSSRAYAGSGLWRYCASGSVLKTVSGTDQGITTDHITSYRNLPIFFNAGGGPTPGASTKESLFVRYGVSSQLMVRLAVTLCVNVPDVPVNVKVRVPVEAFALAVIVAVACAEPEPFKITCVGEMVQAAPDGAPLQESDTLPLKAPSDVTVNL